MRSALALLALALLLAATLAWVWLGGAERGSRLAATTDGVPAFDGEAREPALASPEASSAGASTPENASELREAADLGSVIVRVLHATSREPLEGFHAEMKSERKLLAQDLTDRTGTLRFHAPAEENVTLLVTPPFGWSVIERLRHVEPRADGRYATFEFLARPSRFARFRARLLDRDSGDAVPDYLVRVGTREGGRETLVSDTSGFLASENEYGEGPLMLFFYDRAGPGIGVLESKACYYLEVDHAPVEGEVREEVLRIPVGPTYRLELEAPASVLASSLTASLRVAWPGSQPLSPGRDVVVRRAPSPWVRFRPEKRWLEDLGAPVMLVVVSEDGRWYGETAVPSTKGVHEVAVTLEARGKLVARVVDPAHEPISGATVQLHRAVGSIPHEGFLTQTSSGNGLIELNLVPPGSYLLSAISPAHERRFVPLAIEPGKRLDAEITLTPALLDGEVSGRVVLSREHSIGSVQLHLLAVRPTGRPSYSVDLSFEREGDKMVSPFSFAAIPRGDYRLLAYAFGPDELEPSELEVSTPTRGLELRSHSQRTSLGDGFVMQFRALDARGGGELASIHVEPLRSGMANDLWSFEEPPHEETFEHSFDPGDRWRIGAPSYVAAVASSADAVREGERWVLSVRLERGFAASVTALGPGLAPLEGVEAWLDGRRSATSDSEGRLELRAERAPTMLELRYRDWIVEPSDWGSLDQLLRGDASRARVLFSPP
jgi:hypothetical protein